MTPEKLLIEVWRAPEDQTIPRKVMNTLREAGLCHVRDCSDGDYLELTDAGREALRSQ